VINGEFRDQLIISVRTSRHGEWAGKIAIKILKGLGTGGGHEKAAGGRVLLASLSIEERRQKTAKIINRFLKTLGVGNEKPKPLAVLPA